MNEAASAALADPALGNDTASARDLLFKGADISWDFYAAAQNAATNGHAGVLKLVLAADPEFHETKQDALRAAGRAAKFNLNEILINSAGPDTNSARWALHQKFVAAKHANDRTAMDLALDKIVALMFPHSPHVE